MTIVVAIPPTTSTFLHYQQKILITTPCISLSPSKLTQLQALCGTEHRAFVPPIDLNRPDVVSLRRGRPIIRSVAKKNHARLAPAVQHPARPLIINYSNRSVRGHWLTTSMYLVRLVRTHIYEFLLWFLGKISCHTDHIYDFGINIGGRQAIYMGFANNLRAGLATTLTFVRQLIT